MEITKNTKLKDIAAAYPWLVDELIKSDGRLKIAKTPMGKMMIRTSTVADASRLSGIESGTLIEKLRAFIKAHEQAEPPK